MLLQPLTHMNEISTTLYRGLDTREGWIEGHWSENGSSMASGVHIPTGDILTGVVTNEPVYSLVVINRQRR